MDIRIEAIDFLDRILADEWSMQDTINQNHPDFIAGISEEVDAYSLHEKNKMMIEIIKSMLEEAWEEK